MKPTDYIVIQAPMVTELGLSGNRLIIYALIHGFCKDGEHKFIGSINYICGWTNLSRNTVITTLKSLVDDGLLVKEEYTQNNVRFCSYQIRGSAKIALPVQKLHYPSKKSAPNNILYNKPTNNNQPTNNNKEKEKILKEKDFSAFEECWIAYNRKGSKKKAKEYWCKLSETEKDNVLQHIKVYVTTREKKFQKDFERYLRDKTFNDLVIKDNIVVFDPNNETDNSYHPITGGSLTWNDYYKCFMYTGWYSDRMAICDGYDDDKRPNGATIVLNNGRGTLTWDKQKQQWIKS